MAQDNTGLYLLMGVGVFAALYFTKQFCPGGALPTDALDGRLCPGPLTDTVDNIIANTDSVLGIGGKATPPTGWNFAIAASQSCPRSYVRVTSGAKTSCVCNSIAKKCGPNTIVRLMTGNKQDNVKGNCTCFKCSAGYTASNNSCVPSGPAGTVTGGGTSTGGCNKVCPAGFKKNNNPCSCVCNSTVHPCGANATLHHSATQCACTCNAGYVVSGNKCVPNPGNYNPNAVAVNNAKLFLADVINRTVQACTGRNIGTTAVVQGYPSAITSMAKMNNYSQNKILAYNNRPFAKTFRSVVMAIVGSYKLNLSPICTQQMACLNSMSLKECHLL